MLGLKEQEVGNRAILFVDMYIYLFVFLSVRLLALALLRITKNKDCFMQFCKSWICDASGTKANPFSCKG